MLLTGCIMGMLAWLSLVMTFRYLPQKIQNFLLQNPLISDILASAITLLVLGGMSQSIVSILGTLVCAVLTEIGLYAYSKTKKLNV